MFGGKVYVITYWDQWKQLKGKGFARGILPQDEIANLQSTKVEACHGLVKGWYRFGIDCGEGCCIVYIGKTQFVPIRDRDLYKLYFCLRLLDLECRNPRLPDVCGSAADVNAQLLIVAPAYSYSNERQFRLGFSSLTRLRLLFALYLWLSSHPCRMKSSPCD